MFFKKAKQEEPLAVEKAAWDQKTVEHFIESDRFDVSLTSVTRRRGLRTHGSWRDRGAGRV